MTTKVVASTSAVTGLVVAVLTLLVAFGVNISADQHTAIEGIVAAVLVAVGGWFHPSIPVGPTKETKP